MKGIINFFKSFWFNIKNEYSTVDEDGAHHQILMHINQKYYILTEFRDMCFYGEDQIETIDEALVELEKQKDL
jgi:hypothetical protein